MATEAKINDLTATVSSLSSVDQEKLLRPNLGEESLASFKDLLDKIIERGKFAVMYAQEVSDESVSQINAILLQIYNYLNEHAGRSNADYVTQKETFLKNIASSFEQLKLHWPPFVAAAVEMRGFLDDEGIKQAYEKAVESMKKSADATLVEVKEQASRTIEEAKGLADQIENKARQTAVNISVKDAQEQFEKAQPAFDRNVLIWAGLSLVSIIGFIVFALKFAHNLPVSADPQISINNLLLYYAAIRITVLTAIGATATFCLRIFRAQLHMKEQNLHRQRIANSISSFVESAATPEQRDLILAHLVDSVISFGNSGLISEKDDSISPAKFTIDSIAKNITLQGK